jgi:hypothetical protein
MKHHSHSLATGLLSWSHLKLAKFFVEQKMQ